jgi:hypothetical protein
MYSDTQIIAKDGSYSINVNITSNAESTIGDVFEELSDYGITGSIDSSGKVVLSGDNIVSGDVIESLLGLDTTEITCIQSSSSMQSPTVTTYAELTEDTLLTKVKIAGDAVTIVVASSYSYTTSTVTAGQTAILYDKNKNAYGTFTVSSTSTISDLLNAINNNTLGVSATLTDSQIVIEHGSIGGQLGTLFNGVSSNVYYAKPITTTLSIAKNAGIAAGETVGTVSVTRTATSGLTALSSVDSSTSISSGTYKISTTADLAQLATMTNNGLITGGTYILANDIDLSSCENWTPIGTRAHAFTGTFDGNGYTISNMTVSITSDSTDSYIDAGLFGCVEYGTIKNIGLTSATVNVSSQDRKTKQFIGGLI